LKVNLSRTWTWEPKTGQVTYESKDKDGKPVKVTYNRNQLNSAPANVKDDIEPAFTNDNYWFIFPFHVYWDTSATVTVTEKQKLPIGKGTATLVSVKYAPEVGGYTPGDTWDLYVGADGRVVQFIYHRGGPKKPSNVTTTWQATRSRPTPYLHGPSRDGRRQAGAHLLFECGLQASRVGQVDGRAVGTRSSFLQIISIFTNRNLGQSRRWCRNCRLWAGRDWRPCGFRAAGALPE
jgi:hypothetical protein